MTNKDTGKTKATNPADTPKGEFEKDRAKSENQQNDFKQKKEADAIKHGATPGEIELPVKTVPSSPSPDDPNRDENDWRKNPDRNPNLAPDRDA